MKILLTGATGYIGKRLLPVLLSKGHEVVCCVRDRARFDVSGSREMAGDELLEDGFSVSIDEQPGAAVFSYSRVK